MAKTPQHVNPRHMYTMFNSTLKEGIGEKDLGVTFDSEINFRQHIKDIISKANSRVRIIQRTFTKLTKHNFLILNKSLVRPLLEYCPQIWAPMYKDIVEFES